MKPSVPFRVSYAFVHHCMNGRAEFLRHLARSVVEFGHWPTQKAAIDRALSQYFLEPPDRLLSTVPPKALFPDCEELRFHEADHSTAESEWPELPARESAIVRMLTRCREPMAVFEVGTYKGRTTRLFADHIPEGAVVYTLDLPPERMVEGGCFRKQDMGSIGERLREYRGRSRVVQLFGDSRSFDFSPYYGRMDVVFIDGDHRYDTVLNDSIQAFKMIRARGMILWDDYHPAYGPGVMRALAQLSAKWAIAWIEGTRLAIHMSTPVRSGQP